jgi:chemotaxis protein CheX
MIAEPEIHGIASSVWGDMLGLPLEAGAPAVAPECICARVGISGAFSGTVTVELAVPLARRVAAALFAMSEDEVSDSEVSDAVGEVVNILGGNLKAMLPGPSALSLPTVGPVATVAFGRLQVRAGMSSDLQPVWISLFEAADAGSAS